MGRRAGVVGRGGMLAGWVLLAALAAACGDDTSGSGGQAASGGSTGGGGAGPVTGGAGGDATGGSTTTAATTDASATGSTTTSASTGGATCDGAMDFVDPECEACMVAACCAEMTACTQASEACARCPYDGDCKPPWPNDELVHTIPVIECHNANCEGLCG